MNKVFTLFALILFCFSANGQLKITEISYNPPESGTDSLEYVEIYNTTDAAIDLAGYVIQDNNAMDTLSGSLPAGGYVLTASNPGAIMTVLGLQAIPTLTVAYRNGGEPISILALDGTIIDVVEYSDEAPWPTFADGASGGGASIELCNLEADGNNGANWRAANNSLGVTINDREMFGTPGAANTTSCEIIPDVTANGNNTFTPADITINVGETVVWANAAGFHNVNGSLATYPNNPEGFTNGAPSGDAWTFSHTFNTPGVYDYRCDPHATQGMVGTVTVEGDVPAEFPLYDVATITTNDANGVADSLGRRAAVIGITHGTNFREGGLQFTLIDAGGDGIGVFSGDNAFGITYEEGLEVKVSGFVSQFNGLTQINAENVEFISSGNALTVPLQLGTLGEETESQLVITGGAPCTFVDPSQWGNGNATGFNVDVNDGFQTYNVRIDNDSPLFEADIPDEPFRLTGIGGQFDSSQPFTEGYQIAPRYLADFDPVASIEEELDARVVLYPNPAQDVLNIETDVTIDRVEITTANGQLVLTSDHTSIYVGALAQGMYFVKVYSDGTAKVLSFTK